MNLADGFSCRIKLAYTLILKKKKKKKDLCDKYFYLLQQKLIHHMNVIHFGQNYTRNSVAKKPRKPRKDKGCSRLDYARLLSGYDGPEEEDPAEGVEPEVIVEDGTDAVTYQSISTNPQSKEETGDENESRDRVLEIEEF